MRTEIKAAAVIGSATISGADSATAAVVTLDDHVCVPMRSVPGDGLAAHEAQTAVLQHGAIACTFSRPSIEQAIRVQSAIKVNAVAARASGAMQSTSENKAPTAVRMLGREVVLAARHIDRNGAA